MERKGFRRKGMRRKGLRRERLRRKVSRIGGDRRDYIIPCCTVAAAAPCMAASPPTWSCPLPP